MPQRPAPRTAKPNAAASNQAAVYTLMLEVERFESLAEDMEEFGVATLTDVRRKIAALHQQIDALAGNSPEFGSPRDGC